MLCQSQALNASVLLPLLLLPYHQVKELLAPYGALKSFNLVMDKNTGKSKVR
jgi:hypothetical protein